MAKQKNTGKTNEPRIEDLSKVFSDFLTKIDHLIEILERIESRLNGGF